MPASPSVRQEMKLAASSVAFTDMELRPTRHAGRGGMGAVMGSKGVKVIVLDDTGMSMRQPKMLKILYKEANKKWIAGLQAHGYRAGSSRLRDQRAYQHYQ